jgi:hypothetical protein
MTMRLLVKLGTTVHCVPCNRTMTVEDVIHEVLTRAKLTPESLSDYVLFHAAWFVLLILMSKHKCA